MMGTIFYKKVFIKNNIISQNYFTTDNCLIERNFVPPIFYQKKNKTKQNKTDSREIRPNLNDA